MSVVAVQVPETAHVGDGVTKGFVVGFDVPAGSELIVTVDDVTLTLGEDYAFAGGTVTFTVAPVSLTPIHFRRRTAIRQSKEFPAQPSMLPTSVEGALNERALVDQELAAQLARTLKAPIGGGELTPEGLIQPALDIANDALGIAGEANGKADSALDTAGQALSAVDAALQNGITNNSGSFLRFPADGGVSTAGGGEGTFLMREPVSDGNLVRVYRNTQEVNPGVHYTVDGSSVGTWITPMAEGETWNGVHTGSVASNLAKRTSYQTTMPGSGNRMLHDRLDEEWRLTDLAGKAADGETSWGAALNALFQHEAAQGREIAAPPGTYLIDDVHVVIPRGTHFRIMPGAMFVSGNGKTMKMRGTTSLPDQQCFDGEGFTGIRHVAAHHFGPVIPDFDEGDYTWTTDCADAMIRANACVIDAALSDGRGMSIDLPSGGAFAVGKPVVFAPRLHTNFSLKGAGTGIGDTRFYSVGVEYAPGIGDVPTKVPGTGGSIRIDPGVDWQEFAAFLDIAVEDFYIFGGDDEEYSIDPLFKISNVNGLSNNRFHNILVGEGRINIQIRNSRSLTLSSISSRSGIRPGTGLHILRESGSIFCGDFQIVDAIHISQPKIHSISKEDCELGLGPVGILIENRGGDICPVGVTGYGLGEIRGIFLNNIVNYPGQYGRGVWIICEGVSGQLRTVGDFFFGAQQLAAGFDGPINGFVGFDVSLKGNAKLNGVMCDQPWFESYYGACIRVTKTVHLGITPTARTMRFAGVIMHYSTGRLIEAYGVLGLNIDGAAVENSGQAAASPSDLMRLVNCGRARIRDVIVDRDPDSGWDGYATLLTVDGAASKNIVVSDCVGGTANTVVRINGALEAQVHETNNVLEPV